MIAASPRVELVVLVGLPLCAVLLAAGCGGGSAPRRELSRTEAAVPERDPSGLGTPQDRLPMAAIQEVAVRVQQTPEGGIQLLEVLSPPLSEAQRAELVDAMSRGSARPATAPPPGTTVWVTTIPFPSGGR
ncbi:MAG: hypothetical protein QM767_09165 [Anaeromyxobacter sp.]